MDQTVCCNGQRKVRAVHQGSDTETMSIAEILVTIGSITAIISAAVGIVATSVQLRWTMADRRKQAEQQPHAEATLYLPGGIKKPSASAPNRNQRGLKPVILSAGAILLVALLLIGIVETTTRRSPVRQETRGTIIVPGNDSRGVQLTVPVAGRYEFSHIRGAYCVFSAGRRADGSGACLTGIRIFEGPDAQFNGDSIDEQKALIRLWDLGSFLSIEDAEAAASGKLVTVDLRAGVVTLVAVDSRSFYATNPGSVTIGWRLST